MQFAAAELLPHDGKTAAQVGGVAEGKCLHLIWNPAGGSIVRERLAPGRQEEVHDVFGSGEQERLNDEQDQHLS